VSALRTQCPRERILHAVDAKSPPRICVHSRSVVASFLRCLFDGVAVVAIVPAVAIRLFANAGEVLLLPIPAPKPRELLLVTHRFLAAVFLPLDLDTLAQYVGCRKRSDIHPHAVVDVGMPANGLFSQRFPADEDVVGRLAFEDEFERRMADRLSKAR
jgi:hypothetical protein